MSLKTKLSYRTLRYIGLISILGYFVIFSVIFFVVGIAEENAAILDACKDKAEQVCDNHDMEFQSMHKSLISILVECKSDCELATYEVNCG